MKTFSFEKSNVWPKSLEFSEFVYGVTRSFPNEEKFGLISQMRSASISVISNISEGSGRRTGKEKARFTEMSYSSALEILNQAILSFRLGFVSKANYDKIRNDIGEITAMLDACTRHNLKKNKKSLGV